MTWTEKHKTRPRKYKQVPIDISQARCLADRVLLYIRYAVDTLKLSPETAEFAVELYKRYVRGEEISTPRSTAAGIVYVACLIKEGYPPITQLDVTDVLLVNPPTLLKQYKKIKLMMSKER